MPAAIAPGQVTEHKCPVILKPRRCASLAAACLLRTGKFVHLREGCPLAFEVRGSQVELGSGHETGLDA